jgi:hypothetical protein
MATLLLGGPIQDYRHHHLATAVDPHVNVDIANRWAHSGLWTLRFGGGCWPIHKYRHKCFGGPIQDYRHLYFMGTVGPFDIIDCPF